MRRQAPVQRASAHNHHPVSPLANAQGTIGLEILRQSDMDNIDYIFVPIGGFVFRLDFDFVPIGSRVHAGPAPLPACLPACLPSCLRCPHASHSAWRRSPACPPLPLLPGGGGMIAGIAAIVKALKPEVQVRAWVGQD